MRTSRTKDGSKEKNGRRGRECDGGNSNERQKRKQDSNRLPKLAQRKCVTQRETKEAVDKERDRPLQLMAALCAINYFFLQNEACLSESVEFLYSAILIPELSALCRLSISHCVALSLLLSLYLYLFISVSLSYLCLCLAVTDTDRGKGL